MIKLLKILFEDESIIIVDKEHGVPSQPDKTGAENMVTLLQEYLKNEFVGIVHRLDRPVGGVMVFAKTELASKKLSTDFCNGLLEKEYMAIVCGEAREKDSLSHYLLKNERLNISKVVNKGTKGAKLAKLDYTREKIFCTENDKKLSLIKINLLTGRHHQIRVQLSSCKLPIWGDTKYNELFSKKRQFVNLALFSHKITFQHPKTNKQVTFTSDTNFSFVGLE